MKTYQQYINGEFRDSHSKEMIEVINPFKEKVIALAPNGDAEDAEAALNAAKDSQPGWAAIAACDRAVFLKKMAAIIRSNRIELAKTLAEEQAKVLGLAQVEIDVTAEYFDYYAGWARNYEGEIIQSDRLLAKGYGEEDAISSNATAGGRAENRRIEFHRMN